jgi:programmed cell death protein 5
MDDFASNEVPEGFSRSDPNGGGGGGGQEAQQKQQQIQQQKEMILEQALDHDALARLGRIKMVKPERATSLENMIVSMAVQGKLPGKINEAKLIEILERSMRAKQGQGGNSDGGSGIQIQRKRYSLDSDDEDDDDDDV